MGYELCRMVYYGNGYELCRMVYYGIGYGLCRMNLMRGVYLIKGREGQYGLW